MNEDLIFHYLKKIMVTMPVEIVSVDAGTSLCTVKPLLFDELEMPLIVKCPFMPLGNKNVKFKVQTGQKYQALFSQLDLSNYISKAQTGQINSGKPFSFTNCVILPVFASGETDKLAVPEVDIEITGTTKFTGDMEIIGNIKISGNIEQDGGINSSEDIVGEGISLVNHTHNYNPGPGGPTPTQKPQ
ncbi:MAG: hypothetical protein ACRC5T_06475 [Cetobacterium sp.]